MIELLGRILSLDFCYSPTKKIRVHTKCSVAVICTNEHNMVIWFGFLAGDESISQLKEHLRRLRLRLIRLGGPPAAKVLFYVDNCCNIRKSINEEWLSKAS